MKLGKPLIPILDRNETSEIQIYASAYYSDFYPWKMFDGNVNTHWDSYSDKNPIVSITFKKVLLQYKGYQLYGMLISVETSLLKYITGTLKQNHMY